MREVTKEWLENGEDHSFYLIGDTDRRNYYPAIIGIAKDNSHVVYSRPLLITCFMEANDWQYYEAEEWIDFNVEPALPYYGDKAPALSESYEISPRNKKYDSIKVV